MVIQLRHIVSGVLVDEALRHVDVRTDGAVRPPLYLVAVLVV